MEELARTTGGRFVESAGRRGENAAVSRALDDLMGPSEFLPAGTTFPLDLARRALIGALLVALAALFLETVPLRVFP